MARILYEDNRIKIRRLKEFILFRINRFQHGSCYYDRVVYST